ncbi:hypothetical protein N7510_000801 [Penicillium lagena]|uniref:uncharacterized protein n=1 Tax=Penicillium lagena TaxID=94218 RepID=UPI002540D26B|nr:uncharacterized protein N7510_000801 [Penicillium lagena]KAJ5624492.1 hypothetical protein N7510_000801 [Penicillium lagena]
MLKAKAHCRCRIYTCLYCVYPEPDPAVTERGDDQYIDAATSAQPMDLIAMLRLESPGFANRMDAIGVLRWTVTTLRANIESYPEHRPDFLRRLFSRIICPKGGGKQLMRSSLKRWNTFRLSRSRSTAQRLSATMPQLYLQPRDSTFGTRTKLYYTVGDNPPRTSEHSRTKRKPPRRLRHLVKLHLDTFTLMPTARPGTKRQYHTPQRLRRYLSILPLLSD